MWFDLWEPQFCGYEMQGTGAAQGPLGLLLPQPGLPSSLGCDKKGTPHRLGGLRAEVGKCFKESRPVSCVKCRVRDWLTPSTRLGFRLLFLFSWRFRLHFFPFGFFNFTFSHSEAFIVFTPTKIRVILRVFTWNRSHLYSPLLEDAGLPELQRHLPHTHPCPRCVMPSPGAKQGTVPGCASRPLTYVSLTSDRPLTSLCLSFPCIRWGGPYCLHHGALVQTELMQVMNTLPRWCSALPMVSLESESTEHVAARLPVGSADAWLESLS